MSSDDTAGDEVAGTRTEDVSALVCITAHKLEVCDRSTCSSEPVSTQAGTVLAVGSSCEGPASALLTVISLARWNWE